MAAGRRAGAPRSPCSPPRRAALRTASRRTTQYCRPTDIHARPSARYLYMRLFFFSLLLLNFFPFSLHYSRCFLLLRAHRRRSRHPIPEPFSLSHFVLSLLCHRRFVGSYRRRRRRRIVVATASVHVLAHPRTTIVTRPRSFTGPLSLFLDEKTLQSSPPRPLRLGTYMGNVRKNVCRHVDFLLLFHPGFQTSTTVHPVSVNGRPRGTTRRRFRARTVSASAVPPAR